ncbi:hypothetical protein N0V90_001751 [Kalmusia sp. IMI 367209]|nr:hypothetical protein N0V90_001751 [Kalmusia sp. IMI 367209]
MVEDLSEIWKVLPNRLNNRIAVVEGWVGLRLQDVALLAKSRAQGGNGTHSALQVLTATLPHRKDLVLYGIEGAIEDFRAGLSTLQTDALSFLQTAFIGQLMESTYRAASMETGRGSDKRRKDIITRRFGSESLFTSHKRLFIDAFRGLSIKLESAITGAIAQQITLIEADLMMLRDENVILESENPHFRRILKREIQRTKTELDQISTELHTLHTESN